MLQVEWVGQPAELFSDEGAVVIVSDLNQHSVNNVVEKIRKNGSDAEGFCFRYF